MQNVSLIFHNIRLYKENIHVNKNLFLFDMKKNNTLLKRVIIFEIICLLSSTLINFFLLFNNQTFLKKYKSSTLLVFILYEIIMMKIFYFFVDLSIHMNILRPIFIILFSKLFCLIWMVNYRMFLSDNGSNFQKSIYLILQLFKFLFYIFFLLQLHTRKSFFLVKKTIDSNVENFYLKIKPFLYLIILISVISQIYLTCFSNINNIYLSFLLVNMDTIFLALIFLSIIAESYDMEIVKENFKEKIKKLSMLVGFFLLTSLWIIHIIKNSSVKRGKINEPGFTKKLLNWISPVIILCISTIKIILVYFF